MPNALKRKGASLLTAFATAATMMLTGCATPKDAQDYYDEQNAKVRVALPVKTDVVTAKTLSYWEKAIAEVSICRDYVPYETPSKQNPAGVWAWIGPTVTQHLRELPTKNVDADAVSAVHMVADIFDDLRKIDKVVNENAEAIGSAIGGGLARLATGSLSAGAEAGAAATSDIATQMALSNAAKTIFSNADLLGLAGIGGLLKGREAERKLEAGTDERLEEKRKTLIEKYHVNFEEFRVTSKVIPGTWNVSTCGLSP
jgi:hypothetical protein